MGPRGAATASVPLKVTGGTPSVYVPAVFDAEENSHVLKPHTTYEGAWKAAEGKCAEDKSLYRFEVWEMELVVDGPGLLAPPSPGDPRAPSGPRPFRIRISPAHLATADRPAAITDPDGDTVADTLGNWWHLAPPAPTAACLNCGADLAWAWDTSAWARADEPERGREICQHPDGTWKPHVAAAPAAGEGKGNA